MFTAKGKPRPRRSPYSKIARLRAVEVLAKLTDSETPVGNVVLCGLLIAAIVTWLLL